MRLLKGSFTNFCSYAHLEFDYSNQGLALISGPTGAGKSTLMDAAAWTLFGRTSKDGAADEVKAWGADEATVGTQEVQTPLGALITVTRIRGKATQNDLYWTEATNPDAKIRGKDVTETQKNLESRLGVTADLYFTSAYFHQFSTADGFFIAKSKDRRDLLERIADLSLPIRIATGASEARKTAKSDRDAAASVRDKLSGKLAAFLVECERADRQSSEWANTNAARIQQLSVLSEKYDSDKLSRLLELNTASKKTAFDDREFDKNRKERQEIEALRPELEKAQKELSRIDAEIRVLSREHAKLSKPGVEICPECLGNYNNPNKASHLSELDRITWDLAVQAEGPKSTIQRISDRLEYLPGLNAKYEFLLAEQRTSERVKADIALISQSVNPHAAELDRLKAEKNPHEDTLVRITKELEDTNNRHLSAEKEVADLERRVIYLTQVYDLSMELRGLLLHNTVRELESKTNHNLEAYFDGELKVAFTLDGDKLEVAIQKSGYDCSFRQLSGGQRAILKVSFGTALMEAAANKAGVTFNCLMFDEALNGMDDAMKIKAFNLFQRLESNHESVIMIDHSEEFKSMFSKRYQVALDGDHSTISQLNDA